MKDTIEELQHIVDIFLPKLHTIPDVEFADKPEAHKWSKQEVMGHLIDSASNNLRRFICGQYEPFPPHIVYHQDFWVYANAYGQAKKEDVIELWRLMNERICAVWVTMPPENYARSCNTSKDGSELHTLQWLAEDYVKHLKHHLNQVIPGSFDIVYK